MKISRLPLVPLASLILSIFINTPTMASTPASTINTPQYCANGALLAEYQNHYAKTNNALASTQAVLSTLSDGFKADAVLSRFIASAADGKIVKEIKTITATTQGFSIDPKTLRSKKLLTYFKNVDLKTQPMASALTTGYDRIALFASVAGFAANFAAAVSSGDHLAHAKVTKDLIDISSTLAVAYRGWQGLSIAFNSVAFLDYALNSFITHAYAIHEEYWWQAYRSYLDERYPKMVTGENSWAALATRADKGQAFGARLTEFWSEQETSDGISTIMERAAHYYKPPGPHHRDALAGATNKFKDGFAARYYTESLKTTLDTFMLRQAENLRYEAEDKLQQSTSALCEYIAEIKSLQIAVTALQGKDAKSRVLEQFRIKATRNTYEGPKLSGPLKNGDIVAFSAMVPVQPNGDQGQLKWEMLDSSGRRVEGASKTSDIEQGSEEVYAKFKLKLSDLESGSYSTRLSYQTSNAEIKPIIDNITFLVEDETSLSITRLWVTDSPKNETHYSKLLPDQTPVFYASFNMGKGLDKIERKLLIRDRSSGDIIISDEGEKTRKGETVSQRTGFALSAGDLAVDGLYSFEVTLTPPDGKTVTATRDFEVVISIEESSEDTEACIAAKEKFQPISKNYSDLSKQRGKINDAFRSRHREEQKAVDREEYRRKKQHEGHDIRIRSNEVIIRHAARVGNHLSDLIAATDSLRAEEAAEKKWRGSIQKARNNTYKIFVPLRDMSCRQFADFIVTTAFAEKYSYDYESVIPICAAIEAVQEQHDIAKQEVQLACSGQQPKGLEAGNE